MIGGLDLNYWKGDNYWLEGWRPDGFYSLSKEAQDVISVRIKEADYSWSVAQELVKGQLVD